VNWRYGSQDSLWGCSFYIYDVDDASLHLQPGQKSYTNTMVVDNSNMNKMSFTKIKLIQYPVEW
jgi:hypothetical protein